jgi:hypothetical protein
LYDVDFTDANYGTAIGQNGTIRRTANGGTGINNNFHNALPNRHELRQNYPNPFNPMTIISFVVGKAGHVSLKIFDPLGRLVSTLLDSELDSGLHTMPWDALEQASGTYICRLSVDGYGESRTLLLLK